MKEDPGTAKITGGRWYFEWETGHIRQEGTDIIIATMANNDHLIGEEQQLANAYAIASVPVLIEAVSRQDSAGVENREEFTWEDVGDNWWAVVDKTIPEGADIELLLRAREVVALCAGAADRDRIGPVGSVFLVEHIDKRFDAAATRLVELNTRLETACAADETLRSAWASPELSHMTMVADSWTAAYLPIPNDAPHELLSEAQRRNDFCRAA
jgi:hypothetical protein